MNEVVGNTVDIPRNADGVNQPHKAQYPPGRMPKEEEEADEQRPLHPCRQDRNCVPTGEGEYAGIGTLIRHRIHKPIIVQHSNLSSKRNDDSRHIALTALTSPRWQ